VVAGNPNVIVFPQQVDAPSRLRAISYHITQMPNLVEPAVFAGIVYHRLQRFEVAMYVRHDQTAHIPVRQRSFIMLPHRASFSAPLATSNAVRLQTPLTRVAGTFIAPVGHRVTARFPAGATVLTSVAGLRTNGHVVDRCKQPE
jgi:hypothetical protein